MTTQQTQLNPSQQPGGMSQPTTGQLADPTAYFPVIQYSGDNVPDNAMDWAGGLSAGAMGANTIGALANMGVSLEAIGAQRSVINAYYNYQNKVADNALGVATAQIDLEEKKLDVMQDMQEEQLKFQEKIARLESQTQVRLAKVDSDGKLERAKIFAATDAFRRSAYNNGQPFAIG